MLVKSTVHPKPTHNTVQ